jgi:hypothetical protein
MVDLFFLNGADIRKVLTTPTENKGKHHLTVKQERTFFSLLSNEFSIVPTGQRFGHFYSG